MHICVVAPFEECLPFKADMVLFAGNTVLSISEHVRGIRKYKLTLPLPVVGGLLINGMYGCILP